MRSLAFALLFSSTLGCACAQRPATDSPRTAAAPSPAASPSVLEDPTTPAATLGDRTITLADLDLAAAADLTAARDTFAQAVYTARDAALTARLEQLLLDTEAKRRGVTVDALRAAEITQRVPTLTDDEIAAFYAQYRDQMEGASLDAMRAELRTYLTEERLRQREAAFLADLRKTHNVKIFLEPPRTHVAATGPSRGPADARVTIVVFSDFECPFCARAVPTLDQVHTTWPNDVRIVFRHYPLPFHADARPAAQASVCADAQGAFWVLHDHFFHEHDLDLTRARALLAARSGFDLAVYDACLSSDRGAQVVDRDMAAAQAAGVNGTPAFFVNGIPLSGAQPFEEFSRIIESELARTP